MLSKTCVLIRIMTMNLSVFANLVHNLSNPYVVAVKKEISGDTVDLSNMFYIMNHDSGS